LQITFTLTESALLIFLQSEVEKLLAWEAGGLKPQPQILVSCQVPITSQPWRPQFNQFLKKYSFISSQSVAYNLSTKTTLFFIWKGLSRVLNKVPETFKIFWILPYAPAKSGKFEKIL